MKTLNIKLEELEMDEFLSNRDLSMLNEKGANKMHISLMHDKIEVHVYISPHEKPRGGGCTISLTDPSTALRKSYGFQYFFQWLTLIVSLPDIQSSN